MLTSIQKKLQVRRQQGCIHNVDSASSASNPFVLLWRWLSFQEHMAPMCSDCIAEVRGISEVGNMSVV